MSKDGAEQNNEFPPAKIIEIRENTVDGTCEDLIKHAREKGENQDRTVLQNQALQIQYASVPSWIWKLDNLC